VDEINVSNRDIVDIQQHAIVRCSSFLSSNFFLRSSFAKKHLAMMTHTCSMQECAIAIQSRVLHGARGAER
jgi:hypothetical protein